MLRTGIFVGDRYEIIQLIGSGGMAEVYKGKDHKLNRFIAMKVLKREYSQDKNFVTKFRGEAQAAAGLTHPNIVNIYDVGNEDGIYYIVMELVEGITLKEYIQKKIRLSVKEAISIAIQVSMGIGAAHNQQIIHRDIKPQNIIVSKDGKVKVTDFGIAKAASTDTIASNVMGSVHYVSPEQARGGYSDKKSDIYSLGITMYEMLTGRVPFDGDTTVNIAIQHLQDEIVPPSTYVPEIPESVEQIVLKCTQKAPDRRYSNTQELINDLKQSLINPEGDFVKIIPINNNGKTRLMTDEEISKVKRETGSINLIEDEDVEYDENGDPIYDEEGEMNPKIERLMTVLGIVAAIIIASIALFLIGKAAGIFKFGPSSKEETVQTDEDEDSGTTVTMPDVTGKSVDEATEILNDLGLGIKVASSEYSDVIEKDLVLSQSVEEGEEVEKNTTIKVVVSKGEEAISVPDVIGLDEEEAKNTLQDYGFNVKREYEYNDTVPSGKVIKTSPDKGADVQKGDTITITVSRGKEVSEVSVPDLRNKNESDARAALSAAGLNAGTVSEAHSDSVSAGHVISQSYSAGTTVEEGTTVDFVLSIGRQKVSVPSLVGKTESEAQAALAAVGLGSTAIYEESDTVPQGIVIRQNAAEGQTLDPGTVVSYVVSSGKTKVTVPNVINRTESDARILITNAGLTVGNVTTNTSPIVASGYVISQSHESGTSVDVGTSINIVISSGASNGTTSE